MAGISGATVAGVAGVASADTGVHVRVGITVGVVVGALQWLMVRKYLRRHGFWIPASIVGWGIGIPFGAVSGLAVATAFGAQFSRSADASLLLAVIIGASLAGLAVAFPQWLVLRNSFRWTNWWMPVSAGLWVIGSGSVYALRLTGVAAGAVVIVLAGIIYGAVTGKLITSMVRRGLEEASRAELNRSG
jgi:hypothetical protein